MKKPNNSWLFLCVFILILFIICQILNSNSMAQMSSESAHAINHNLIVGMASISLFADTSHRVINNITKQMLSSIDETLLLLRISQQQNSKKILFAVSEIPELYKDESKQKIEEEEEPTKLIIGAGPQISQKKLAQFEESKRKPSLLAQKLSMMKVDKQADLRMEQELQDFIEKSTFEDICGDVIVFDTIIHNKEEILDDSEQLTNQQSQRKSIMFSLKKVPDLFQDIKDFQTLDDQLDELRIDFDKIKVEVTKVSSKWSDSSSVQYHMTDYNTNESSNIDNYSHRWKESSQKKEIPLFRVNEKMFEGGVFDLHGSFNNDSVGYQSVPQEHDSPKKKQQRLHINTKKVPHWAENEQHLKKTPEDLRNRQLGSINHDNIFQDLKHLMRGSSAEWKKVNQISQHARGHLTAMDDLMKQFHAEGMVTNHNQNSQKGVKEKLIGFIRSVKKIFNSSDDI